MSNSALSTFLPVLLIVLAMIVWWRAAVALLVAFLIAVLAIGVHEVVDRIGPSARPAMEAVGAAAGGPAAGGAQPEPGVSAQTGPR